MQYSYKSNIEIRIPHLFAVKSMFMLKYTAKKLAPVKLCMYRIDIIDMILKMLNSNKMSPNKHLRLEVESLPYV